MINVPKHFFNSTKYPEDRRKVLIFPSEHGTTHVVNYAADNCYLNSFLTAFEITTLNGHFKLSADNKHSEVWFETSKEFYELSQTETIRNAIEKFGVRVEHERLQKDG